MSVRLVFTNVLSARRQVTQVFGKLSSVGRPSWRVRAWSGRLETGSEPRWLPQLVASLQLSSGRRRVRRVRSVVVESTCSVVGKVGMNSK